MTIIDKNSSRIITFNSDFGLSGRYVSEMKGAFLSKINEMNPSILNKILIVDGCHLIPKFNLHYAARIVSALSSSYPPESIHIIVVDPGVGSSRKPIIVRANSQWFIAPDNGILSELKKNYYNVYEIDSSFRKNTESNVFDGRDLFAPAAAVLLTGFIPGREINSFILLDNFEPLITDKGISGRVIYVDEFGNLITNIKLELLKPNLRIYVCGIELDTINESYSCVEKGEILALLSSDGYLEISRREASAAVLLNADTNTKVEVRWS